MAIKSQDLDTRCVHGYWGIIVSRPSQWADVGNQTIANTHIYICVSVCMYMCIYSSMCISLSEFINSHSSSNAVFPNHILICSIGLVYTHDDFVSLRCTPSLVWPLQIKKKKFHPCWVLHLLSKKSCWLMGHLGARHKEKDWKMYTEY